MIFENLDIHLKADGGSRFSVGCVWDLWLPKVQYCQTK
ncbi:uncharacterized protein METZ01_LOCUS124110 [marine metagenome]|uniref:Uncharacterized protein n=1 Tax=marine metagenome TaxID=408172 RepID=A0A381Y2E5_9ZZZZ